MKYNFISIKITIIKKKKTTKTEIATVGEDVGKGKIGRLHTHGGTVIVQLLWKTLRFFLKILKM